MALFHLIQSTSLGICQDEAKVTGVLLFLLLLCVLSVKPHKFLGEEPQRFILFYCRVLGGGEETDPCFSFMLKEKK